MNERALLECVARVARASAYAAQRLAPRERLAFMAGLRAAHMEEALTQGDTPRAIAHARGLAKLARALGLFNGEKR